MIYETNDSFPFDRLTLLTPKPITGGNHFSRFHIDDSPVFVQLPKCNTKQGIQVSGNKKAYTDLQFTQEQERFLKWTETLVEKVQDIVCQHSSQWFANEMDKVEIEETFQSILKPYRSGQIYLMRVNIPIRIGKITLPIFDEDEKQTGAESVKPGGYFLGVLELQGLKYSSKSIQLELEMKQILLLPSLSLFEKCVLTTPQKQIQPTATTQLQVPVKNNTITEQEKPSETKKEQPLTLMVETQVLSDVKSDEPLAILDSKTGNDLEKGVVEDLPSSDVPTPMESTSIESSKLRNAKKEGEITANSSTATENPQSQTENESITLKLIEEQKEELQDVDISLENMTIEPVDTLKLKNSKEIYYKMYRQARQKAKLARDLAISSYLESRHIKNIYVLEDLSDDEDEQSFFKIQPVGWKKVES